MSVHYRFKSAREYDTIAFDGLHISVKDLRNSIIQQKKIGKSTDFDLRVTNAQTQEVYENENTLIPKNTSLLIARVPVSTPKQKQWEGYGGNDTPPAKMDEGGPVGKAMDLSSLDAPEDDKIKAMMSQSTQDYDPSNYQKIKGSNQVGPVPSSYRCYKCHQYGHWIKDCLAGKDAGVVDGSALEFKKSTGIPRDFMVPVDGPQVLGAMMLPNGTFAVPVLDMQAYNQKSNHSLAEPTPKPEIPEDLVCSICSDLLADAVMIPCCGNSFCDECIRSTLLESEDRECPDCHEKDVSPATLIPNRFLRKSVSTFKNTTGYEKKPIYRPHPVTEISPQTELPNEPKEQTPPPLADSTENGKLEEAKTVISEADSTEQAKATDNDFPKQPDSDEHHLRPEARTPEQPPGCSPISDYSPKHQIKSKVTMKERDDRHGNKEREWEKYHKPYRKSRSPSPGHHRRRRSRSSSPYRRRSSRSPLEGTATPTRDELSAMGGPPGFMAPGPHPQPSFNAGVHGVPPMGPMQGPPMNNMPPGTYPPMGQQQPSPMAGFPPQGPPPNFGMPPPGTQPPVPYMNPGPYPMPGVPPGHPPFNPAGPPMGGPPPNFAPPNPNNSRGREFNRGGRNRTPPNVIEDPLAAFNRIIAAKDEQRARRARQAAAARKSWSRSPSPRRSYSRSPPPRRRSRSPLRRRSRSRSFSVSRSRSRSFSKSPIRRKVSPPPLRRSPPPLREPPPPRRGGPPPQSSHYRSPDRGRSPLRRGGRNADRDHEPRDYRDTRDYRDERPRDHRDNKHHAPPRRDARRDSRERHFDERGGGFDSRDNRRDNRGGAPPPPQNQWGNRDGYYQAPPQQMPPHQQQGYQGMNRFQPRDFGPPMTNPMPPNMQPPRRYDDIRPPGVEEPPIPGLESEPPIIDEFKKKPEKYDSPRERYSPKVDKDKEKDKPRDRDRERERDKHTRRTKSRTPEFRNPSPKDEADKHKKRRSRSSESSNRRKDKDHSDDDKKSRSKDKRKKDKKEREKKKKDKKDKHKKDKDKKSKDEFRQVIPKNATTDDEDEGKILKKKKLREEKEKAENEKLSAEAKKKEERKLRFLEDEKRRKTEEETKRRSSEESQKKIEEEETKEHKNKNEQEEKELEEHVNTEMSLYSNVLDEGEVASDIVADVSENLENAQPEIKVEINPEEILEDEQQQIEPEVSDIKKEIVDTMEQDIVQELPVKDSVKIEDIEEGEVQDELEINNQSHEFTEEDPSILELHSSDMDKIIDNDNSENLVPLPEKSKWETDEDGLIPNSPLDTLDQKDAKKDKITNEVLKRAENAIFAKAINAIKPIEIKKISNERAKLYADEKPRIEERETVVAKIEVKPPMVKPKVEVSVEKPKVVPEKPRIPVKARLGIKVEDTDKIISLDDKFRDGTLSPFSRKERRIDLKDLRRRDRSRSPRSRRDHSRERRVLDSKSRSDRGRDRKDTKAKSEERKKDRRKRSRTRSPSSDHKKKKKDKKVKKDKDKKDSKKKEDRDSKKEDENPKAATEKRKPTIDESNFEPDYDLELHPTDADTDDDKKAKKAGKSKEAKSESSSDSSSSSSEEERKKKKKKRSKKKRKRSTSSSDSDTSSDSSDSEKERKKRKHKKSKKKKKKSKHK